MQAGGSTSKEWYEEHRPPEQLGKQAKQPPRGPQRTVPPEAVINGRQETNMRRRNQTRLVTQQEGSEPPVPEQGGDEAGQTASRSSDRNVKIIVPPAEGELLSCPWCAAENRILKFIKPTELRKHVDNEHIDAIPTWSCRDCGKDFAKLQGWSCHHPKCKKKFEEENPYRCDQCEKSFKTKIGLGQHERHEHPTVRNDKRAKERERTPKKKGVPNSVWSEEDIQLLRELNNRYRGVRNINMRIAEHMPHLTNRQIGEKRRAIEASERAAEQVAEVEEEQTPQPEDATEREAAQTTDRRESTSSSEEDFADASDVMDERRPIENWQLLLLTAATSEKEVPKRWQEWHGRMKETVKQWPISPEKIEDLYNEVANKLRENEANGSKEKAMSNGKGHKQKHSRRVNPGRAKAAQKSGPSRSQLSKYEYARSQDLYNNDPKKLADIIAKGDMSLLKRRQLPEAKATERLYKDLWGTEGPQTAHIYATDTATCTDIAEIWTVIKPNEIVQKVKTIKSSCAAGPDGITKTGLKTKGAHQVLACMLNILLATQYYPEAWRVNRTTLLPKEGKPTERVENWRPITIGSIISRTFSALIDKRLRRVIRQSSRQKGFKEENGCYNNVRTLSRAIQNMKAEGGILGIQDMAKAFDTVPHSAIEPALMRKGIHPTAARYIGSMYRGCHTVISVNGGKVAINIERGVKQGDPLSPLLFNLCIEPLLDSIQDSTQGVSINESNLAVMAFADDLVTMAKDRDNAIKQMELADKFLNKLGMELSIAKCSTVQYVPTRKAWYIKDPKISIHGVGVKYLEAEDMVGYLGARISPWKGLIESWEPQAFADLITRLRKVKLKPLQKIDMLTTYLLPRYTHGLITNPPPKATLEKINITIREEVKKILHISEKTSSAFIHTSKKDGGLGIPDVEKMVYVAALRNAAKAHASEDGIVREVVSNDRKLIERMMTYAAEIDVPWPPTMEQLDRAKEKCKQNQKNEWCRLSSQGQGARDLTERESSVWLKRHGMLQHSRIADAIKMRTNTFPTRVNMKNYIGKDNPTFNIQCRRCQGMPETLGHILGLCIHTKEKRIKRHNEIRDLVADRLARKGAVLKEQSFSDGNERYRPDLVAATNEGKAYILDVTVRYERGDWLRQAQKEKTDKYNRIRNQVRAAMSAREVAVVPIVVGARGTIPRWTKTSLKRLGIKGDDIMTIAMIALRSSLEMANEFMDYGRNECD